jgi:hypothetical protein
MKDDRMVAAFSTYGEITKSHEVLVWNADRKRRIRKLRLGLDGRAVLKRKSFICVTQFCGPKLIGSE